MNLNRNSMKTKECKRAIVISALWCYAFVGVYAIINCWYFLTFTVYVVIDYAIIVFPAILYRYKLRKYAEESTRAETAVVMAVIEIIALVFDTVIDSLCGVQSDRFFSLGLFWLFLIVWILRHKEKDEIEGKGENEQKTESNNEHNNIDPRWAEVLFCLPYRMKWDKIKDTDFGAMLKKIYLDNVAKQADKNKMACYVIVAASLAVCEDRARCGRLKSDPPSRIICDCADKITKKMYRKHYINDTTADSLKEKTEHWRQILCAK